MQLSMKRPAPPFNKAVREAEAHGLGRGAGVVKAGDDEIMESLVKANIHQACGLIGT